MAEPFIDPALFAEFNNVQIQIVRDGQGTDNGRGVKKPGAPVVVLELQGAQEWELSESDTQGLTGEEIRLMKKVRMNAYYPELTEKMTAIVDGVEHNIVLAGHDGSKSCSLLTLRRVKG
ncbi:hypothetical protein EON80_12995 [bacterium]|nr:MAG: hypothetical protein EON80_12995 [bacterium]